jgi:hypothetical protein
MTGFEEPLRARTVAALWLLAGLAAVAAVSVPGLAGAALAAIAGPPPIVRAILAGVSVVGGLALLGRALRQIDATRASSGATSLTNAQLAAMVRGIRLVFLAAAALSAAAGWVLGDPLPLVVALVIAGVDLAETSLLLLVALGRGSAAP